MHKRAIVLFSMLLLVMLLGCTKVTQENYNKLKLGLPYQEVVGILGKADECQTALGTKKCFWGSQDKRITVNLISDKVIFYSSEGL